MKNKRAFVLDPMKAEEFFNAGPRTKARILEWLKRNRNKSENDNNVGFVEVQPDRPFPKK